MEESEYDAAIDETEGTGDGVGSWEERPKEDEAVEGVMVARWAADEIRGELLNRSDDKDWDGLMGVGRDGVVDEDREDATDGEESEEETPNDPDEDTEGDEVFGEAEGVEEEEDRGFMGELLVSSDEIEGEEVVREEGRRAEGGMDEAEGV